MARVILVVMAPLVDTVGVVSSPLVRFYGALASPTCRNPTWRRLADGSPAWRNPLIPDKVSSNQVQDGD
jgi:hypothetical protein